MLILNWPAFIARLKPKLSLPKPEELNRGRHQGVAPHSVRTCPGTGKAEIASSCCIGSLCLDAHFKTAFIAGRVFGETDVPSFEDPPR